MHDGLFLGDVEKLAGSPSHRAAAPPRRRRRTVIAYVPRAAVPARASVRGCASLMRGTTTMMVL